MCKSSRKIENNEYLFTTDIVAMYSNIDTKDSLVALLSSYNGYLVKYTRNL